MRRMVDTRRHSAFEGLDSEAGGAMMTVTGVACRFGFLWPLSASTSTLEFNWNNQ
jgi:hypothetical protein